MVSFGQCSPSRANCSRQLVTPPGSGNSERSIWTRARQTEEVQASRPLIPGQRGPHQPQEESGCQSTLATPAGPGSDGRWCSSQPWASLHTFARIHQAESRGPSQSPGCLEAPQSGPARGNGGRHVNV
uniref:Inosine triphosphate pyrophosphatase isoform X2 n=1 Tax=Sus scrofa TaxID=9823 RepID=A0A480H288_PIG